MDTHIIETVKSSAEKLVKELPLLRFILEECGGYIYGGFLRWTTQFIFENEKEPDLNDCLEYLRMSDVDIKIRSRNSSGYENTVKFFQMVSKLGGYIEFAGNDYESSNIDKYRDNLIKIGEGMRVLHGCRGYLPQQIFCTMF